MNYCEHCMDLSEQENCPKCGQKMREISPYDFCLIMEDDYLPCKMYMGLLDSNNVKYVALPKEGEELNIETGVTEKFKVYVHYRFYKKAKELLDLVDW